MELISRSADEVSRELVRLVVESRDDLELGSHEVLAQLVRRVASFKCPTTNRELAKPVLESLKGLVGEEQLSDLKELLLGERDDGLIDSLIGCGDLQEVTPAGNHGHPAGKQLYLGAPAFLRRDNGDCLVIGIRSEGRRLLPDFEDRIEHTGHVRWFRSVDGESPASILGGLELRELLEHEWLRRPVEVTSEELVSKYDQALNQEIPIGGGQIEGLELLDSDRPSRNYRARWGEPTRTHTGNYVARRPQAYSAPRWCYVAVDSGQVKFALDLPLLDPFWARGCDEAWRLQAAIDKNLNHPLVVTVTGQDSGEDLLNILSMPPPRWVQRRLDTVGRVIQPEKGWPRWCFRRDDVDEEIRFLEAMMFCRVERR